MQNYIKNIGTIVVLYLLAIAIISFFHYQYLRGALIRDIDTKLNAAVHSTRAIIGTDFHDNLVDKNSVSEEKDFELGIKLYEFAQVIDVKYLYSLKRFDNNILFVVSSATDEELALDSYEPAYFSKYPEMDDAIVRAFDTQQNQTAEYHDRWGAFRSVFVPFKTDSGEVYVIGADVSLRTVESRAFINVVYAFITAICLGLLLIPAIIMLIKSLHREWQVKYHSMFKDELTGLPNRYQLMNDLIGANNTHLALIDIKNFSDVTNTYGAAVGDDIIQQFATRLNNFYHHSLKNYQAYRVNGDVFAIFENQPLKAEEIIEGSQILIDYLQNHRYKINSSEDIKLVVTIGGVNQNEDAYMLANMALEEAKRNNIPAFVYDSSKAFLPDSYKQISKVKQQLQLAFDEDRLVPYFQPIFNAKDHKIAKYECLARIVDSSGNIELTPDIFIPVARRARIYAEITRRMVTQSIQVAKNGNYIISINLSISDIMNGSTRRFLYQSVKNSRIASRIQFEILETEAIDDLSKVRGFISKIQNLGAKVGIDDLGRSYSNFDRLSHLPVDFIKIDGSIITSIEKDADAQAVTKDIVLIAHRHNIKVTAEYCHNEATTVMAVQLGVDYLQGFHLGKPERLI